MTDCACSVGLGAALRSPLIWIADVQEPNGQHPKFLVPRFRADIVLPMTAPLRPEPDHGDPCALLRDRTGGDERRRADEIFDP